VIARLPGIAQAFLDFLVSLDRARAAAREN